ncbi:carboxypeptidase regulatory-like domain-containing protein [Gloeocapsopsis crepidinum LEGE 06123]|uniref:Carboxypeptidase regulatory-like domain-containing protein n=1 Tax=Gloeocapsopsis crepidinum LEGE 06123 TaxID=588587 RepID=A0ABR9USC1_9CHRO|nr:carboxypeptidase-like regulatory domain-containing protein [Gloeocapsopsis crepidinum]MBE9191159.1 carboxypeptidase regulatory-like domain-containing protein [Gloeocapsopsis crepidinum LEGE 06123]
MNSQWKTIIPFVVISVFGASTKAIAHGVRMQARETQAIEVNAEYDNGEPMAEAQVTVYAPNDPATPWLEGTTDNNGNFVFAPDSSQSGNWSIQVRQAGHGSIVNIPVEGNQAQAGGNGTTEAESSVSGVANTRTNFTPLQTILMGATGVWGFIGTALFFMRGNKSNSELRRSESQR